MSAMDYGNLAYLILLGAVIVFWFFVQNRQSLNKTLQQGAVWGLIFVGVIAAVGLWGDIRLTVQPQQLIMEDAGRIEVPRGPDGHYYLTLDINDAPVRFVVDTGATSMVLTQEDAKRVGLDEDDVIFYSEAMTANGLVRTAPEVGCRKPAMTSSKVDLPEPDAPIIATRCFAATVRSADKTNAPARASI